MLTVIIIFIRKVNEVVLSKENHSRSADISFAGDNTDTTFKTPTMRNLVDRKEFVKVFFGNFIGIVTDHVVKELIDWKTQLSQKNSFRELIFRRSYFITILGLFKGVSALFQGLIGLIEHENIGGPFDHGTCFETGAVCSDFTVAVFGLSVYFDEEIFSLVVEVRMNVLVGVSEKIIDSQFFDKKELGLRVKMCIEIELDSVLDPKEFILQKEVIPHVIVFKVLRELYLVKFFQVKDHSVSNHRVDHVIILYRHILFKNNVGVWAKFDDFWEVGC